MRFEDILKQLNARSVFLDHLGQLKNGKEWSATVRKKGSTNIGYGCGKDVEQAVKAALSGMRDRLNPVTKPKRKRNRIG